MEFLKSSDPVVVDTHVLVQAAVQCREGSRRVELEFLEQIIERCPQIWLSTKQRNWETTGELFTKLHKYGFRPPYTSDLFLRLDQQKKLRRSKTSAIPPLPASAVEATRKKGHANLSDDTHLLEIARNKGAPLVTMDEWILQQRESLERKVGISCLHPADALRKWEEEP